MVRPQNERKDAIYVTYTEAKHDGKGKRKCFHEAFYGVSIEKLKDASLRGVLDEFPLAKVPVEIPKHTSANS